MKVCAKCGYITMDDSDEFCIKCGAYYSKEHGSEKTDNPMAAALGITNPPAQSGAVPIPDDGTMDAGFDHLSAGNFPEGLAQWTSYIRANGQPTDDVYQKMLDAMADCIVKSCGATKLVSFGVYELAMELESDLIDDLLTNLSQRIEGIGTWPEMVGMAIEMEYLAMASLQVFPDMRDAQETITTTMARISSMKDSHKDVDEVRELALYRIDVARSSLEIISNVIKEGISEVSDDKMDKLSDYWSSKANLPYVNIAFQLTSLHRQVMTAAKVGRLTYKLYTKAMLIQIKAFKRSYFEVSV